MSFSSAQKPEVCTYWNHSINTLLAQLMINQLEQNLPAQAEMRPNISIII